MGHPSAGGPARSGARAAAFARAVAALERLGDELVAITGFCRSGYSQTFTLPLAVPTRAPPTEGCGGDILAVLRDAGCRLTLSQIEGAFARLGKEWSDRTLKRHLADLLAAGWVDNDPNGDPPGYGVRG
jgi:hypothetical protein